MLKWSALIRSLATLVVALLLLWVGMSIPRHFRAISPLVLQEAGQDTVQLPELADDALARSQVGLVQTFWQAYEAPIRQGARERYQRLLRERPIFQVTGGPSPYLEQLWARVEPGSWRDQPILPALLPSPRRAELRAFLEQSSNATVQELLATRELSGWANFLPAFSAGGQPLDATVMLTALLEQSQAFQPNVSRELRSAVSKARAGDREALTRVEAAYGALLTLGMRLKWVPLEEVVRRVPDLATLEALGLLYQRGTVPTPQLTAAILLGDDLPGLVAYLAKHPEDGAEALHEALGLGRGAVATLLRFDQGLYHPPAWVEGFAAIGAGASRFKGLTEARPWLALALKITTLLLGGYLLALVVTRQLEGTWGHRRTLTGKIVLELAHVMVALTVGLLLALAAEPRLLEFAPNQNAELTLDLAQFSVSASLPAPEPSSGFAMLDHVTLIVLLLYFLLQLGTFLYCVLKIRDIRNRNVPATVKLRLLDNEELLFDLGLYIGISGTVASLMLIVLKLVEASLMAAYSSTLFGIVFVAMLKILILRPYKQKLILESEKQVAATATPEATAFPTRHE